MVVIYESFRISDPTLLGPVLGQYDSEVGWAIALTRQLEALLKKLNLLDRGLSLSIQEIINQIPFDRRDSDGNLYDIEDAKPVFERIGTILAPRVPLSFCLDLDTSGLPVDPNVERFKCALMSVSYFDGYVQSCMDDEGEDDQDGADLFEEHLWKSVCLTPISLSIRTTPSYRSLRAREVYIPTLEELEGPTENLIVLATGVGIDDDGNDFIECQNFNGERVADLGFTCIGLGLGLIRFFVNMVA